MTLPTREKAHEIVMSIGPELQALKIHYMHSFAHYLRVAKNAEEIAKAVGYLDENKAYVMGLLHDYGYVEEVRNSKNFHGLIGYQKLMDMGYDEAARASLVHSFFEKEKITPERYKSYDAQSIRACAKLLSATPFDDYDRLVHLADLMAIGTHAVTVEARFEYLAVTYDIDDELLKDKYALAMDLKKYFDDLCGQDVYSVLHIGRYANKP